jgi:hypothetical protein
VGEERHHGGVASLWGGSIVVGEHCRAGAWSVVVEKRHRGKALSWKSIIVGEHCCGGASSSGSVVMGERCCWDASLSECLVVGEHCCRGASSGCVVVRDKASLSGRTAVVGGGRAIVGEELHGQGGITVIGRSVGGCRVGQGGSGMMRSFASQSMQKQANGAIGWCPHAGTNRDKLPTLSGQGYSTG